MGNNTWISRNTDNRTVQWYFMYHFIADVCGNKGFSLSLLSSSNLPFPFCPHYGGITRATNDLHYHSRFWDLLPWHGPFHWPVLYWDLQAPSSPTWAVVLLHLPPGFSSGRHRSVLSKEEPEWGTAPQVPPPHSWSNRGWGRGKKGMLDRSKSIHGFAMYPGVR